MANVTPFLGLMTNDGQNFTNVQTGNPVALMDLQDFFEKIGYEGPMTGVFNTVAPDGTYLVGPQGPQGLPGQNAVSNIVAKGAYDSTVSYTANDMVIGSDNNGYICLADECQGVEPTSDATKFGLFVMAGAQGIQGIQGPQGIQGIPGTPAVTDNSAKPHSWPSDGTIQTFADGTHGVRRIGSVTIAANGRDKALIASIPINSHCISSGGYVEYGSSGKEFSVGGQALNPAINPEVVANSIVVIDGTDLLLYSTTSVERTANVYDVWVRYWTEGE